MHDPLNMSVQSRMGVWEKKVDKSLKEKEEYLKSQQVKRIGLIRCCAKEAGKSELSLPKSPLLVSAS